MYGCDNCKNLIGRFHCGDCGFNGGRSIVNLIMTNDERALRNQDEYATGKVIEELRAEVERSRAENKKLGDENMALHTQYESADSELDAAHDDYRALQSRLAAGGKL